MNLPYEVLELIATFVANTPDTVSPPSALVGFFCLSRSVHDALLGAPSRGVPTNNAALASIFKSRYDMAAPERRIGGLNNDILAAELKKRCLAFLRIKRRKYYPEQTIGDLWLVYLMLLEDDGKNMGQLEHAGVEAWIKDIVVSSDQLCDDDGWPMEVELVQLAVAILSIFCDRECVARESQADCQALLITLRDFLIAGHRYPISHLPDICFNVSYANPVPASSDSTLRTMASRTVFPPSAVPHFGHLLTLTAPRVADGAICAVLMRNERQDSWYSRDLPRTREEADALQWHMGATQADWQETNLLRSQGLGVEVPRVRSPDWNLALLENPKVGSERWDVTFWRMACVHRVTYPAPDPDVDRSLRVSWFGTMYEPGMFTGNWVGRYFMHDWRGYMHMLDMHPASLNAVYDALPDEELGQYFQPLQFSLREHIATDELRQVACGEPDDGIQNGWFPHLIDLSKGSNIQETGTQVVVRDPREHSSEWEHKYYQTWYPGMNLPMAMAPSPFPLASPSAETGVPTAEAKVDTAEAKVETRPAAEDLRFPPDVEMDFSYEFDDESEANFMDVIITGETDYVHGRAWGAYTLYGRVRSNDGLVVLVRAPQDPDPNSGLGRWVFRGYSRGGNALVGRWRETGTAMDTAPYEGAFVICKVGKAWGLPPVSTQESS